MKTISEPPAKSNENPRSGDGIWRIFNDTILFRCDPGEYGWTTFCDSDVGVLIGRAWIGAAHRTLWLDSWLVRRGYEANEGDALLWIATLPQWSLTKLVATSTGVVVPTSEFTR